MVLYKILHLIIPGNWIYKMQCSENNLSHGLQKKNINIKMLNLIELRTLLFLLAFAKIADNEATLW